MDIFKIKTSYVDKEGQFGKHHFSLFSHDKTKFKKQDIFLQQCVQNSPTAM